MNQNIQEIIKPLGIQSLNKMQEDVLASYPNFDELVILSNTGSGKTLAFLLPLLLRLPLLRRLLHSLRLRMFLIIRFLIRLLFVRPFLIVFRCV